MFYMLKGHYLCPCLSDTGTVLGLVYIEAEPAGWGNPAGCVK
ncbi:hypothetical protein [Lacrimispora sp.]|nr:hypothetical protein [Lacrimispora sp.]